MQAKGKKSHSSIDRNVAHFQRTKRHLEIHKALKKIMETMRDISEKPKRKVRNPQDLKTKFTMKNIEESGALLENLPHNVGESRLKMQRRETGPFPREPSSSRAC